VLRVGTFSPVAPSAPNLTSAPAVKPGARDRDGRPPDAGPVLGAMASIHWAVSIV
jgi:hypothetical protein